MDILSGSEDYLQLYNQGDKYNMAEPMCNCNLAVYTICLLYYFCYLYMGILV